MNVLFVLITAFIAWHGLSFRDENGNKDFDWYRFEIYETGLSSILISSEFPVTIDIFNIGDCSVPQLITTESYNSCEQNTFMVNLPSGTFAAVVKTAPEESVAEANILVSLLNLVSPPVDVTEVGAACTLGIVITPIEILWPEPTCQ